MGTFQDVTSEAVIGTLLGFYGGSSFWYMFVTGTVRNRWPAPFHEEISTILKKEDTV